MSNMTTYEGITHINVNVIPVKTGIQNAAYALDSHFRGNDVRNGLFG